MSDSGLTILLCQCLRIISFKGIMMKVAVLLSTYNGERYLKEQVDSILAQTGVDVTLYVRDDGSSDKTVEMLREYGDDRIVVNVAENAGPANSFMELVYSVPSQYDYYAFADQDDIWDEDKLCVACTSMTSNERPTLYASNQTVADAEGKAQRKRYDFVPPYDLLNIIDKNYLSGCTFVMNNALMTLIKSKNPSKELLSSRMHDTWIIAVAAALGKVIYDDTPHIRYRQHEVNVVGVREESTGKKIKQKMGGKHINYHAAFADELLELYGTDLTGENRKIAELYSNSKTLSGKLKLLRSQEFKTGYRRKKSTFAIKLLFFEGRTK